MRPGPFRTPLAIWLALLIAVTGCAPAGAAAPAGAGAPPTGAATATTAPSPIGPDARPSPASASPGAQPKPTAQPSPTARPAPATAPPSWTRAVVPRLLQAALDDARSTLRIPGISATIVLPDGTSWTGVSGQADVRRGEPVADETAFAIASISKTFLAALVLELSAEGAFALQDSVAGLLPGIDIDPTITVRMLLDHTSGLDDYFLNPKIDRALQREPTRHWTPARALRYVRKAYFPPGTNWHYSNTNYLLLGLLVEATTGQPLATQLRERFLDPLDLATSFYQSAEEPRAPLAHGYRLTGSGSKTRPIDLADGSGIAPFRSVVTAAAGAGSVAASSRDVAMWARALYGGEAISPESLSLMLSGVGHVAAYRPRTPYGLGVQAIVLDGHRTFGHSGRFLGFRSLMRWLPDEGVAIAVLTNQSRVDPAAVAIRLLRIVLPDPRPVPAGRPS
jgi:D-alanyl-D-alanine carboxypeptidase